MALIQGQAVNSSSAGGFYPKTINGSLRFNDDDSAYLSWTPSGAGNRKTYTWSGWIKLGSQTDTAKDLGIFTAHSADGANNENGILLYETNKIAWTGNNYSSGFLETSATLRDPSAWYHIVVAVDTSQASERERVKIYINGVLQTSLDNSTYPSLNAEFYINNTNPHKIGNVDDGTGTGDLFDGYMAEVFFIDGTAHDADAFGETKNGVWVPKNVTSANFDFDNNNSFHLTFEDDAEVEAFNTVLYEGNGNTDHRISGAGLQPDFVWIKGRSFTSGHQQYDSVRGATKRLQSHSTNGEDTQATGLKSFDSDGFTVGSLSTSNTNNADFVAWCWDAGGASQSNTYVVKVVSDSGNKYRFDDFGTSAITLELSEGGTYRFDQADSSNSGHPIRFSTTSDGTHGGGSEYTTGVTTNGTPGSAGAYTEITVASGAPTLYYYCSVHSGMGGQANTPSTKGYTNVDGTIQSTVVASDTTGFSVVKFDTTATSTQTFGHGLSAAPDWVITKRLDSTSNWAVYHSGLGTDEYIFLNGTDGKDTATTYWNDTAPSSSVVTLGSAFNASSERIAYCWTETAGVSKFGTYTGNGSTTGPTVTCGFKPAWVIIKQSSADGNNWNLHDNTRDTVNPSKHRLLQGSSSSGATGAETTLTSPQAVDFNANGFQLRTAGTSYNGNLSTYIYAAFADTRSAAFWLDQSSNNNDWQPENLDYMDSLSDSPTNNYATMNAISGYGGTLSDGNLAIAMDTGSTRPSNFGMSSGKWYWEVTINSTNWSIGLTNGDNFSKRVHTDSETSLFDFGRGSSTNTGGKERASNSTKSYDNHTPNVSTGIYGFALDLDAANPKCDIYYNNTLAYTFDTFTLDGPYFFGIDRWNGSPTTSHYVNFGQQPFVYDPPS